MDYIQIFRYSDIQIFRWWGYRSISSHLYNIIDHDLNTKFDGMYLFIDCDTRKPYINTVPTDGLTLMSYLHWGASLRLSELELAKLNDKLNDNLNNNLVIIRPEINILDNIML